MCIEYVYEFLSGGLSWHICYFPREWIVFLEKYHDLPPLQISRHYTLFVKKTVSEIQTEGGSNFSKKKITRSVTCMEVWGWFFFEKDSTKLKASFFFDVHIWQMKWKSTHSTLQIPFYEKNLDQE